MGFPSVSMVTSKGDNFSTEDTRLDPKYVHYLEVPLYTLIITTSHKGYVKDWVPSVSMVTSKGDNFSIKPKKKRMDVHYSKVPLYTQQPLTKDM